MNEQLPPRRYISHMQDGYGDFCLFPGADNMILVDVHETDPPGLWRNLDPTFPSKDGSGFPFLRLPRDIRDMVYDFLLEPFRDDEGGMTMDIILKPFNNKLEYTPRGVKAHPYRPSYDMNLQYIYSSLKRAPETGYLEHVNISKQPKVVFYLSQVCRQMREEVGKALYNNVYITAMRSSDVVIDFLKDRPAAHAGIKHLDVEWECEGHADDLDDKVIPFCEYVAGHLSLDLFRLLLQTSVSIAKDIIASDGQVAWVQAFRRIKMKKLHLMLALGGQDDSASEPENDSDDDALASHVHWKLESDLALRMKTILHPARVGEVPASLSEQDRYLQDRAAGLKISKDK